MKQLAVDLVILNERGASYVQDLQVALETLVRTSQSRGQIAADGVRGAVFILRTDLIPATTRAVLPSVARVVLVGQRGSLDDQLDRLADACGGRDTRAAAQSTLADSVPVGPRRGSSSSSTAWADSPPTAASTSPCSDRDRRHLHRGSTSSPIRLSDSRSQRRAAAITWSLNSRENQLTPWSNDPVTDRPGEAIYLRDEETGELWGADRGARPRPRRLSTCASRSGLQPVRAHLARCGARPPDVRPTRGPDQDIAPQDPQHFSQVPATLDHGLCRMGARCVARGRRTVHRDGDRCRDRRDVCAQSLERRVRLPSRVRRPGGSTDRLDRRPAGISRSARHARRTCGADGSGALSKRVGAGLDPCGALQTSIHLAPGETVDVVFFLGEAADAALAHALLERYRSADLDAVFRGVVRYWDDVLGTVQVKTPDRSMDIILNRWMLYQTLACRMWARSAFYQASGAYGFRDQLQDGMALAVSGPAVTREHLLRAASRQFAEGDVQHWWLPPTGQGVRTRISDDRIWLAFATSHYVETTGDTAVLDESVPFIEGQALHPASTMRTSSLDLATRRVALRTLRARAGCEPCPRRTRSAADRHG